VRRSPLVPLPGNRHALHQPIALSDALSYLVRGLDEPGTHGETFDAGGPDSLSYGAMVDQISTSLGRRRVTVNVPLVAVRTILSAARRAGIQRARVLLEAVANMQVDMVCQESAIRDVLPGGTKPFRESFDEYLAMGG